MSEVLVLVSHPRLSGSKLHQAMLSKIADLNFVTVRNIDEQRLADCTFEPKAEQEVLLGHDKIVLQFPLYWYSSPSSLKQYIDDVLSPDFTYPNGDALNGKTLTAAVTAGAAAETYSPDGLNVFTLEELLIPFRMTAKATNMEWVKPWAVFGTPMLSPEGIEKTAADYAEFLTALKG